MTIEGKKFWWLNTTIAIDSWIRIFMTDPQESCMLHQVSWFVLLLNDDHESLLGEGKLSFLMLLCCLSPSNELNIKPFHSSVCVYCECSMIFHPNCNYKQEHFQMIYVYKQKIKMCPFNSLFIHDICVFHRALLLSGSDKSKTKHFSKE